MSEPLDQLKKSLEQVVANAVAELNADDKAKLAASVERSAVHALVGNAALLKTEANTVASILWAEGNARARKSRRDLAAAVSKAIVQGAIAAI